MEKPQYIDWIVEETGIVIKDDIPLKCYKIDYKDDESILDDWALHIRRNYIEDTELKEDADDNADNPTKKSESPFLTLGLLPPSS